jgi:hypothetical protein
MEAMWGSYSRNGNNQSSPPTIKFGSDEWRFGNISISWGKLGLPHFCMGDKIDCFPDKVTVIIVIVHTMSIWFNQYPVMCYLFRCNSKQKIENNDVLITFPIWMFPKPKYPYFVHERHFAIMNTWICISKVTGARFVFIIKGEGHLRCLFPF